MKLMIRLHKDDSEMVELFQRIKFRLPGVERERVVFYGLVHIDMFDGEIMTALTDRMSSVGEIELNVEMV